MSALYKVYLTAAICLLVFIIHLTAIVCADDVWQAASILFILDLLAVVIWGSYVIWEWLRSPWGNDDDLPKEAVGDHPIPNELVLAEVEEFGVISYKLLQYRENPPHWVVYPDANSPGYTQHSPCCPAIRWVYVSDIFRL